LNFKTKGKLSYTIATSPVKGLCLVLEKKLMDKDRVVGSAKEIKGKTREVAGKVLGDAKLESVGKADEAAGKIQNAVGGVKDTLKGK
jgi:uncharacterized protein YjbJ (UPF0337 family)